MNTLFPCVGEFAEMSPPDTTGDKVITFDVPPPSVSSARGKQIEQPALWALVIASFKYVSSDAERNPQLILSRKPNTTVLLSTNFATIGAGTTTRVIFGLIGSSFAGGNGDRIVAIPFVPVESGWQYKLSVVGGTALDEWSEIYMRMVRVV